MSTFSRLYYHIVFGTKYRKPAIKSSFRERLYQYIGGTIRELKGSLVEIGGIEDHVHILLNINAARALAEVVRDIKANSSRWVNEEAKPIARFEWQKGYSAFTVSHSHRELVCDYIHNQAEHHRNLTFKEEYMKMLRLNDISFSEEHLFEAENHG